MLENLAMLKSLTKSQKKAYFKIKTGKNVNITGLAGTGKTHLLNNLQKITGKRVFLTASSGSSAIQLNDGRTISSFLGLGMYDDDTASYRCRYNIDDSIIVIDEIGMIGANQWKYIMRSIRKNATNANSVQIVIAGDPKQMPPIYWDKPLNGELKDFAKIELEEIVRQKDKEFIEHLKDIRDNGIKNHLEYLIEKSGNEDRKGVTLVSTRAMMDEMNATVQKGEIIYSCNLSEHRQDDNLPYEKLEVWAGMKVLITSNNFREGYVNGDTGIVESWQDDDYYDWHEKAGLIVRLDRTGEMVLVDTTQRNYKTIEPYQRYDDVIEDYIEDYQEEEHSYYYMPILPAYYLSVRRAQGATLEFGSIHKSILDADIPTQYTAFSRFKSIENINLDDFKPKKEVDMPVPEFEFTTEILPDNSMEDEDYFVRAEIDILEVSNRIKKILKNNIETCGLYHVYDVVLLLQKEKDFPTSLVQTLMTKNLESYQFEFIFKNLVTFWHGFKTSMSNEKIQNL